MNPEQLQRLLDRLVDIRNTDDLFDLEQRFAPFDEDDALTRRALFQIACTRCHLSRGPTLSPDTFALARPAPSRAREQFEMRGRVGTRTVRIGWADGELYGSLYAMARLGSAVPCIADAATARALLTEMFDAIECVDEQPRAVA